MAGLWFVTFISEIFLTERYVLGIWDGHDSGAALLKGNQIVFAANEERFTRRKLEVCFPKQSILEALQYAKLQPTDVKTVAVSTSDFAKTLTRAIPSLKENYYLLRRKKLEPTGLSEIKKAWKYRLSYGAPNFITQRVSDSLVRKELNRIGFQEIDLHWVDHHTAHAATAAVTSALDEALVMTLDGIGDGRSGSFWLWRNRRLEFLQSIGGHDSLGIFFEHVTNLMNMRELEDEGKVMALANYSLQQPFEENPMRDFFAINGMRLTCRLSPLALYRELKRIHWRSSMEQFCFFAQSLLEVTVSHLASNALRESSQKNLVYAGGVASNIKVNLLLRELPELGELYVFPHMGDGGLALGSALHVACEQSRGLSVQLDNLYLGNEITEAEIEQVLAIPEFAKFNAQRVNDPANVAADKIADGEVLFWVQGRMEYGPRALGARSILARPDSLAIKQELNVKLKKRVWFQPFCPSLLEEEVVRMVGEGRHKVNQFMTCGYRVKPEFLDSLQGVTGVDGTCRPQFVVKDSANPQIALYRQLLEQVKVRIGIGAVLNTSLNVHGEPLVCTARDAFRTFAATPIRHMVIGRFLVTKNDVEVK